MPDPEKVKHPVLGYMTLSGSDKQKACSLSRPFVYPLAFASLRVDRFSKKYLEAYGKLSIFAV